MQSDDISIFLIYLLKLESWYYQYSDQSSNFKLQTLLNSEVLFVTNVASSHTA